MVAATVIPVTTVFIFESHEEESHKLEGRKCSSDVHESVKAMGLGNIF